MNALEGIVNQIYGDRLAKCSNQGNAHYLFSLFEDVRSKEVYYLRAIELPTFLYISEATTELISVKYGTLVPKFQIIPVDRNFQAYTYLVRSPINIIPLSAFLQIKKDCGQPLDIDFFLRFLQFAKNSFKIVESHSLPLFSIGQIGITEGGQFVLCDPSCYFTGHNNSTIKEQFGSWIADFVISVLNLPLNEEQQQELIREYFGEHLNAIRPFFEYLMSGQATLEATEAKLANAISRFSDEVSTVTGSFVDVNQLMERSLKGSSLHQSAKFKKIGKFAKLTIVLVVLGILAGVGFFCFKFFNRTVLCGEGQFLNSSNQCLSCSNGCLRCDGERANQCTKCDLNMYLILSNEQDKQGQCLNECRGRLIKVDVCVMNWSRINNLLIEVK